ncbi:hypothetical protein [Micromonospora globbae]|jgi:hypothetical protein|uniref:DUF2892 domain-containing protein n=1 Tax=Micromonospora globbae TaxID=1894969 RepID=A0ABZ1S174_9ACTN|nr:hypothetical protein [Micromonospora globbae]
MSNAKIRSGLLLLLIAAAVALLTMPVHRLWGIIMLFVVATAAGCVCLAVGLSEDRKTVATDSVKAREESTQA